MKEYVAAPPFFTTGARKRIAENPLPQPWSCGAIEYAVTERSPGNLELIVNKQFDRIGITPCEDQHEQGHKRHPRSLSSLWMECGLLEGLALAAARATTGADLAPLLRLGAVSDEFLEIDPGRVLALAFIVRPSLAGLVRLPSPIFPAC